MAQQAMAAVNVTSKEVRGKCASVMQLIRSRPEYLNDKDAVQILSKAVINGNKILRSTADEENGSEVVGMTLLCDYAQLLLDFSYAVELKIVNEEFVGDCNDRMQYVFKYLDEVIEVLTPVTALQSSVPLDIESSSKIKELMECVYWRKGALLYMYCHTAYYNQSRLLSSHSNKHLFLANARHGVKYLAFDMRQTRIDDTTQEYVTNDDQLLLLIKQGIFSDVNMLSLIYAAEMCHWIVLLDENNDFNLALTFNPKTLGGELAGQYLRIAKGPLKESNWNIEQAVIIHNHLQA